MKKLLGIIVLGFLWSNVGFAGCNQDVVFEFTPNTGEVKRRDYTQSWAVKNWHKYAIIFEFDNPTAQTIEISYVALKTENKEILIEEDNHDLILNPFTKNHTIVIKPPSNLMTELGKYGAYKCGYVPAGTISKKAYKKKNSPQTKVNKNRLNDDFNTWWGIVIVGVVMGLFFLIANKFDPIDGKNHKKKFKS